MAPDNDQHALALTMVGEARGEGIDGMTAVGNVVMNRVNANTWFGDTVKNVCLKPWQFSCWNQNDPNREYLLNLDPSDSILQQALGLADGLIAGTISDNTNGATSYYANTIATPKWAEGKEPCAVIGHQIFFKGV